MVAIIDESESAVRKKCGEGLRRNSYDVITIPMPRPKKPTHLKPQVVSTALLPGKKERVEALADKLETNPSEVLRIAIDALLDANPIDDLELARWRKRRAKKAEAAEALRSRVRGSVASAASIGRGVSDDTDEGLDRSPWLSQTKMAVNS